MKIRKGVLLEALKVLGKVVAQTSLEEVVRSVRFVGDGGRLRLMATDGVECVAVSVECEVAEAIDFAVEYRTLRMLQQRYTKFRAHSDGRMPVVAEGGAGCYVTMPILLSPKSNPQTNQEASKMETNEIKETDSRRESANEAPDPMEELKCGIDELRGKLKLLLDETGALTCKVKEAVLRQKQKERDFILAKRAIERIKMAI